MQTLLLTFPLLAVSALMCPACPTALEARSIFWSDFALPMAGMLGPFVVAVGLVALVLVKLGEKQA